MDDIDLSRDVLDELACEPSIDASRISVTVAPGVATLSGHVPNYAQTFLAEQAALRVKGVCGVTAKALQVAADASHALSDDDIARRALTVLDLNVLVPQGAIEIKVCKGRLELSGEVEWEFQRLAAIEDLRKLRGVIGVHDAIVRSPKATAVDEDNVEIG